MDHLEDHRATVAFARDVFPEIAALLDRALPADGPEGGGGSAGFSAALAHESARFREANAGAALADLQDAGVRDRVVSALQVAGEVVAAASRGEGVDAAPIAFPEPERFMETVSASDLERALSREERRDVPGETRGDSHGDIRGDIHGDDDRQLVPAPYGLGAAGWRALFRSAAEEFGGPLNTEEPLVIADDALAVFAVLDRPDAGVVTVRGGDGLDWSLRVIPSGPRPPKMGLSFAHGPHVSLPEMLMLQLMRIRQGLPPVDQASFTWLAGTVAEGRLAARHVYDAVDRAVRISCRETGNQGPHLGARTPLT